MLDGFTWFKQAAYRWQGDGLTVYIDPWEVTTTDVADLIVITHAHFDHFSPPDIEKVSGPRTVVVAPHDIAKELSGNVTAVAPGEVLEAAGVHLETVPAYNVVEERLQAHPKENGWVGYLLTLGGHTYYHAGDTDHLPELERLRTEVAFLPIGGTYTMDADEAAGLARAMAPSLAVPMHYGFVVGSRDDAETFRAKAAPVEVRTLEPVHPFTQ
ncbi:MAG: MBL fold metallo-hydrolase [Candidatus Dormibacteria bacterium]